MNNDQLWQAALGEIELNISRANFITWFRDTCILKSKDGLVTVGVPNGFSKEWLENKYNKLILRSLRNLFGEIKELKFIINQTVPRQVITSSIEHLPLSKKDGTNSSAQSFQELETDKETNLNPKYTFENFIIGSFNELAQAAARAIVNNPGEVYNPLFIYGGSGLGKTHLLHAIGNYVHAHDRHKVVLYQPADHFITDFVSAIRQNKVYEFEARYHNIDVLLVDDVQFISKKEQTQEAFFRVFNQLHQKQRQLVFTSDSMPCDIKGLAERMRSRLEGGLITDIQMPLLETKIAILHKKAEANNYMLDDDVAYFIGACECSSVRELEGMLIRVIAYASLTKQPVSVGLARKALAHTREAKKEGVGLPLIARFVGKYFSYSVQELRSSKRNKDLAQARHVAMFFMKKLTDASLREIGLFFERKDHTTVLSALEKIERQQRRDRVFAQELRKIEQDLKEQIP